MPKITNSTIIKHATPICAKLNANGENWNWKAQAALIVRFILEESGNTEMLGADFANDRAAWATEIEKMNYPKNMQNVY